jgi:hypothetical protein
MLPLPPKPVRWIVSPRYDLTFFIGSCVFTFLFFGLYQIAHRTFGWMWGGDSVLITYFLFTALFDHPHIFQTFSRTYADKMEFARRKRLYTYGLVVTIAVGFVFVFFHWEAYLIVGASLYGTWHIIRQHYGFIKIYKAINNDREPLDNVLDALAYFTGMFAGFFHDYSEIHGAIVVYGKIQVNVPSVPEEWGDWLWSLFLVLILLVGFRQAWRAMLGKTVNLPKLLLMASSLSTHYFIFFATATPFLVAEALETAYHDVQYHGWVAHYQRRRFPQVKHVARKWFAAALCYGIVVGVIEIFGLLNPEGVAMWLFIPFTMIVLFHYFVDGLIWRMRDDPELRTLIHRSHI